ncbi:MAG TPA: FlgD immunoglobulin-like domain containing protein, partial [Candidatus Eisenbacteria bacterium]|nr:FlgD immunoglobulin-like domain containing protein [Candidatus Eisenbacteria bacterium]
KNANNVPDLEVCFSKEDLRALFSNVNGRQSLDATVAGSLIGGGVFMGTFVVDVVGSGGSLAAAITPNPPLPTGTLSFTTTRGGAARVRLFDLQGRLVRTISDSSWLGAGRHEAALDGRSDSGARLPSGVYYFRIEAAEGTASGRVALIR